MTTKNNAARVGRIVSRVAKLVPAVSTLGGVGAVVALAPDANATVIHSAATDVSIPLTTAGVYINVVTGVTNTSPGLVAGWDLNPFSSSALSWFNPTAPAGGVYMRYPGSALGSPGNLGVGTVVDGSGLFGSGASNFTVADPGIWNFNAINYIGFRFQDEADANTVHYGFASVQVGATAADPIRNVVDIYYEDQANTGILVGDTGSGAPEPSTALLLATGVAGLLALRRRRQSN